MGRLTLLGAGSASGASAPAAWSPNDIAGLMQWMTAGPAYCFQDAAKTVPCGNGDPVYVWADRSGAGVDLVQATAGSRPTLVLSGGLWRVRFDGSNDRLVSGSIGAWGSTTGTLGCRFAAGTTGIDLFPLTGAGLTADEYVRYSGDGNTYARTFNTNRWNLNNSFPNDTNPHTIVWKASTDYRFYLAGALQGSAQTLNWEAPSAWVMGYSAGGYSRVDVAGVVAYNSALSDANRNLLETYLGTLL